MVVMDLYSMTDKAITEEIGSRIKALRLRRNLTQLEVSRASALSLNSIKSLEMGKAKLSTIVAVLRELGMLEALDTFVPKASISPLQLSKQQGKERQRASGNRRNNTVEEEVKW